jgi:hypothetical protein
VRRRGSHNILDNRLTDGGEVASRPLLPARFLTLIYVRSLVDFKDHSVGGRYRSIEKLNDLIGNQTRDLLACNIVPQQTALPRAKNST